MADALPEIQGLDVKTAVARLDGNLNFYMRLLEMFADRQRDTAQVLKKALSGNDLKLAARIIHTCRGVAGNIGAVRLEKAALELENALKLNGGEDALNKTCLYFCDELERVIETLRNSLSPGDTRHSDGSAIDRGKVAEALAGLKRLLLDNDGRGEEYLEEHSDSLADFPDDSLRKLRSSVKSFDYKSAVEIIGMLEGSLSGNEQ